MACTIAAAILIARPLAAQQILSGPVVNNANGHTYYLLTPASWADSEAAATRLGGHLVTINDEAENNWVFDTFNSFGGGNLHLWIGFTDEGSEGTFRWISGEPVTYTGWGVGEPNNGAGGPFEHHAYIVGFNSGQPTLPPRSWNDGAGIGTLHGVVEIPTGPRLSIALTGGGQASISWTPALAGFILQQNTSLAPESWSDMPTPAQNPTVISTTGVATYYRLIKRPTP